MNTSRRTLCAALLAGMALPAFADKDFPSRPITLIVPFTSGPNDSMLRRLAQGASQELGQPIVVLNRPGAGGTTAPVAMAASAKADGYTISMFSAGLLRYPHMNKVAWNPLSDFTYIIGLSQDAISLNVRADSPFQTLQDMAAWAKANPGKLTYGTPGTGTLMHMAMDRLLARLGVQGINVPYKGTGEVTQALLSGQTDLSVDLAGGMFPQVEGGKARYLFQFGGERASYMRQVPSAGDMGLPVATVPIGLAGPKGMDPVVVERLHTAFRNVLQKPETIEFLASFKKDLWYQSPQAYAKWAQENYEIERAMVAAAGLTVK